MLLALGDYSEVEFGLAARVYAYASSIDASDTAQGVEYLKSAVSRGMSLASITSDPPLSQLYEDSGITADEFLVKGSKASLVADGFISPIP